MVKFFKFIVLVVAIAMLGIIFFDYGKGIYDDYKNELSGNYHTEGKDVQIEIPQGASAKKIASILKEAGLIKYEKAFTKRLQESEYRGKLKAGTYTLNTGMNTLEMMAALSPVADVKEPIGTLIVPEGFTIQQIAKRCEKQNICSEQEFLNAVNSVTKEKFPYLEEVPVGAEVDYKLQGFLFPATYDIYDDTTAQSLVEWMMETFDNYYTDDLKIRADELNLSTYEVITLASIVEREARVEEERAVIAGVMFNRLNQGMKLQVCPSVLYPLTKGLYDKGKVYYEDLELDSPYNTYKYEGLPVGPICNPGIACINAVLYPREHNYLYYHVADEETGEHVFSETYEEHIDTQIIGGPNGISEEEAEEAN